jgi:hypothetical protein
MTEKSFLGKKHSSETKKKISEANALSQLGEKNSQFGTCWITRDCENKKIKKEDLESFLSEGWIKGRSCKDQTNNFPNWLGRKHKEETKQKLKETFRKKRDNIPEYLKLEKIKNKKKSLVNRVAKYRATKRNATPEDADLQLIKKIYEFCPEGYHVDHIIALARGGLHHQDNLQYLPASENCKKCADREYDKSQVLNWKDCI